MIDVDEVPAPPAPGAAALAELLATLHRLPPIGPWVTDAACAQLGLDGSELFTTSSPDADDLALAERVCRKCPVRSECERTAERSPGTTYGMWAGAWYGERGRGVIARPAAA